MSIAATIVQCVVVLTLAGLLGWAMWMIYKLIGRLPKTDYEMIDINLARIVDTVNETRRQTQADCERQAMYSTANGVSDELHLRKQDENELFAEKPPFVHGDDVADVTQQPEV